LLAFYSVFALMAASREHTLPFLAYVQAIWMHWMCLGIVVALVLLGSVVFTAPSSNATICFIIVVGILFAGGHLNGVALQMGGFRGSVVYAIYYALPHLEWYDVREFIIHNKGLIEWLMLFLFICCMSLATVLDPEFRRLQNRDVSSAGVLVALMGDSRRLFAHEFFAKADAYFHSGFYPTIFDYQKPGAESDLKEESHDKPAGAKEEIETSFLGPPKDWIDRFGRHFYPTQHTHLHGGNEREMLPWLKLSADLDPHELDSYLTASYWLRTSLNKPKEAEQFLREGQTANPDSYAIELELGRLYLYNYSNAPVAWRILMQGRQKWRKQDAAGAKPDPHAYEEILGEIVRADVAQGNVKQQVADLEELVKVAHSKDVLQKQIEELKGKLAQPKP
jgi:hypothetical protein